MAPVLAAGARDESLRGTTSLDPVMVVGTERHDGVRVSVLRGWGLFAEPHDGAMNPAEVMATPVDERPERFRHTHELWVDDARRVRRISFQTPLPGGFRVAAEAEHELLRLPTGDRTPGSARHRRDPHPRHPGRAHRPPRRAPRCLPRAPPRLTSPGQVQAQSARPVD